MCEFGSFKKKITEITILQIALHAKHSLDMQARF